MNIFSVRDYPHPPPKFDSDYELLDFGHGRKLERFGQWVLDRPAVGMEWEPAELSQWSHVDARFMRGKEPHPERMVGPQERNQDPSPWSPGLLSPWVTRWGSLVLELRPTVTGQIGVFPEQRENWDWLESQIQRVGAHCRVLNLFAYTGGSTLAASRAGAEVVHVDSQQSAVAWARRNAELSQLQDRPIRWIVEDALKFVQREVRRGQFYHGLVLDPPSYGHGRRGEVWKLDRDLPELLSVCQSLWSRERGFLLLSCHTPGWDGPRLAELVRQVMGADLWPQTPLEICNLNLKTRSGRFLPSGIALRVTRGIPCSSHSGCQPSAMS